MSARRAGGLERWVPGLRTLREYRRSWLGSDLMAGLVLTALLVPVGMGYAQAAGLPPITGLYATIVPLAAYAVFGPSRVMVLGPDSSLAAVIAAVIRSATCTGSPSPSWSASSHGWAASPSRAGGCSPRPGTSSGGWPRGG
jgi:MFS superfamily sulfate permease-like transporter